MADEAVSSVSFDLSLNTESLNQGVANTAKSVSTKLTSAFSSTAKSCERKIKEAAGTINQTADSTKIKIEQILNDTERSAKSKAGSIAYIYKQQGMSLADAMRQAWENIKRVSESSNESQVESSKKACDSIKKINESSNDSQVRQSKRTWDSIFKHGQDGSERIKKSFDSISKKAKSSSKSIQSSFSNAFKKIAIAVALSAAAIIKFGKDCVESAASVNAANSQLAQTFGELQGNAEEAMRRVAKASGIVQSRLQGVGTSIYAFAKTTGMDSQNALSMMEEALQVTADSAAYYDRSLEDTAESLKSFLKGNYENDAALGLSCTETTRNTAANKLYGKSFQDLSESQKQLTLLQMVKDANQLSGAMGQAAREADGWENVIGNLKEAWKQFLAVVGQPILQAAVTVIQKITSAIQTLTEYAKVASNALGEMFGWSGNNAVTASVSSAASSAGALSSSTAESTDNLKQSTKAAEKLKKAVAGFDQLNILSADTSKSDDTVTSGTTSNTVTPVSSASGLKSDENAYNKFSDTVKKVFEKINKAIEPVKKALGRLKEQFDRLGKFAWEGLKDFYNDFLKPIGKWVLGEGLPRFIDAISQMMSNIDWDKINSALDELWKALTPFAINVGVDHSQ